MHKHARTKCLFERCAAVCTISTFPSPSITVRMPQKLEAVLQHGHIDAFMAPMSGNSPAMRCTRINALLGQLEGVQASSQCMDSHWVQSQSRDRRRPRC